MSSTTEKTTTTNNNHQGHYYAHETTPLVEVGTILPSVPTTDLCQGIQQQYWNRAVVLITKVSSDLVNREKETRITDDQLAMGAGRGL